VEKRPVGWRAPVGWPAMDVRDRTGRRPHDQLTVVANIPSHRVASEHKLRRLTVPRRSGGLTQAVLILMVLAVPKSVAAQPGRPAPGAPGPQAVQTPSTDSSLSTEPARVELFAGYSFLPETDRLAQSFSDAGHGVAASISVNLRRSFGLVVDVDSHAWTVHGHGNETFYRGDQRVRLTYLSFGPRFTVRARRLSAFGSGTVDLQWSDYSTQEILDALHPDNRSCCGGSASAWGFGFGGGADVGLTRRIAVRALQVNYSLGGFGQGPGRKLRLKTGVVIRFRLVEQQRAGRHAAARVGRLMVNGRGKPRSGDRR
jgi:hypothetical protein